MIYIRVPCIEYSSFLYSCIFDVAAKIPNANFPYLGDPKRTRQAPI